MLRIKTPGPSPRTRLRLAAPPKAFKINRRTLKQMKNKFVLTRRNQKGQVALFVALIFQVVFIFFALLINVGLLVHHKINLQQSTDIAAYYGAMKQAEILNAISHVNFQMRQAWKLLTWRYRIFGTFGLQSDSAINPPYSPPQFPMMLRPISGNNVEVLYNVSNANNIKCASVPVDLAEIPFFCVGHSGIQGWNPALTETYCKVSCSNILGLSTSIQRIPITGGSSIPYGGSVGASANIAIDRANTAIQNNCRGVGPKSVTLLATFLLNYFKEVQTKKKIIQILGSNLSQTGDQLLDLEGNKVFDGAKNTFNNNLTEANQQSNPKFEIYNSLDRSKNSPCGFAGNATDGEGSSVQFLKEIKFNFLQYFVQTCTPIRGQPDLLGNIEIKSIFDNSFTHLDNDLKNNLREGGMDDNQITEIERVLVASNYILGYEKNPWCQVYTAVKSESKPKIPFLPLSAVTLSAVSFAKPFGGLVGPRFEESWTAGAPNSNGNKTEEVLPIKNVTTDPNLNQITNIKKILLNYSRYVGDNIGLADKNFIAAYHSMVIHRSVSSNPQQDLSYNKESSSVNPLFTSPNTWPSFSSWNKMKEDISSSTYDYLALSIDGNKNSPLRDIELSVIAPNQFDLANYSIDADFYNNYYLKLKSSISGIQSAAASGIPFNASELRPDYGYNSSLENNGLAKNFSVRHQIQVASQIIKETNFLPSDQAPINFKTIFNFLPDRMASLLTGWTYADFNDYKKFPSDGPNDEYTMTFGKCADVWAQDPKSFASPADGDQFPPTPGNCVTGGRVGYSVKLVSPNMVRSGNPQPLGGPGAAPADILNPIDPSFLQF